jgi:hypothetical protein
MISTEAVASRQGPAGRSGLRSWLNQAGLLPVWRPRRCVLFGHDVELAGWRPRSRTRCECQRFPGSYCRCLPEGNWGLGALADDVALIVAEFSSSAWTHGDLPITVGLWLQNGVVTIEVSHAGPGLTLFSGSRPLGTGGRDICRKRARSHIADSSASSRQSAPQR